MSRRQILRAIKLAMESKLPSVVKVVEVGLVAVPEEPIPRVKEIFTTKLANRTFKNS
jgi:hypothetical protein